MGHWKGDNIDRLIKIPSDNIKGKVMLTAVQIIKYLFSMNKYSVKALQS